MRMRREAPTRCLYRQGAYINKVPISTRCLHQQGAYMELILTEEGALHGAHVAVLASSASSGTNKMLTSHAAHIHLIFVYTLTAEREPCPAPRNCCLIVFLNNILNWTPPHNILNCIGTHAGMHRAFHSEKRQMSPSDLLLRLLPFACVSVCACVCVCVCVYACM